MTRPPAPGEPPRRPTARIDRRPHRDTDPIPWRDDESLAEQAAKLARLWALAFDRFRRHLHSGDGGTTDPHMKAGDDPHDLQP
jgi:hypothetical protein